MKKTGKTKVANTDVEVPPSPEEAFQSPKQNISFLSWRGCQEH